MKLYFTAPAPARLAAHRAARVRPGIPARVGEHEDAQARRRHRLLHDQPQGTCRCSSSTTASASARAPRSSSTSPIRCRPRALAPANGTMALSAAGVAELSSRANCTRPSRRCSGRRRRGSSRRSSVERIVDRPEWVDQQLEGRSLSDGRVFSAPDTHLFTVTNWCKPVGIDIRGSNLGAFMDRMAARPAVQEAMKAEGPIGKASGAQAACSGRRRELRSSASVVARWPSSAGCLAHTGASWDCRRRITSACASPAFQLESFAHPLQRPRVALVERALLRSGFGEHHNLPRARCAPCPGGARSTSALT